jgi:ribosomal protein S15P/S13E
MLDQDEHPDTLDGWQDLAIKYQGKWLEAQHKLAQRDSKNPSKQKAYLLKLINQKRNHSHVHPEDHMDVDVTETSDDKKEKWVCYYCKQPGHIKKDCQKRMANESWGKKPQTQVHQVEVIDKEKDNVFTTVRKNIKAMKEPDGRDFLGVLIDKHF